MLKKKMMMKEMENKGPAAAGPPKDPLAPTGPKDPLAPERKDATPVIDLTDRSSRGATASASGSSSTSTSGPSLYVPRQGRGTEERAPLVFMEDPSDSKIDEFDSKTSSVPATSGRDSGVAAVSNDAGGFLKLDMDGMELRWHT